MFNYTSDPSGNVFEWYLNFCIFFFKKMYTNLFILLLYSADPLLFAAYKNW